MKINLEKWHSRTKKGFMFIQIKFWKKHLYELKKNFKEKTIKYNERFLKVNLIDKVLDLITFKSEAFI